MLVAIALVLVTLTLVAARFWSMVRRADDIADEDERARLKRHP